MARWQRVTLQDVARQAKVSPTTASYILNGRGSEMRISAEAEERVRSAAASLGYRPNRTAKNLRTASTRTVGLISDSVASGHFANNILKGATRAARDRGHLVLIGESEGDRDVERLLIDEMLDLQVDGLVYATLVTTETDELRHNGSPLVLANCVVPGSGLPSVLPDEVGGGRLAVRELVAAGLGEAVHVIGVDPNPRALAGPQRTAGIEAELDDRGLPAPGVIDCDWTVADAYAAVSRWLASGGRPEALLCLNDRIAMGTMQALTEIGARVPDDVAIVSFDGSDLSRWLRPQLTSISIPYTALGAEAMRMLLEPNHYQRGAPPVLIPMEVLPGQSVSRDTADASGGRGGRLEP